MKRRVKQQQDELTKLQRFFVNAQAKLGMNPVHLSVAERAERVATDSVAHWLWYRFIGVLASIFQDDPPELIARQYSRAFTRWIHGKAINEDAQEKVNTLNQLGFSRRDLRLAISSRYIRGKPNKDQRARIQICWPFEKFLQIACYLLIGLVVLWLAGLLVILYNGSTSTFTAVGIFISTASMFALLLYPYYVLCIRAPKVARDLEEARKQHPLLIR